MSEVPWIVVLTTQNNYGCFREGSDGYSIRFLSSQLSAVLKKGCRLTGLWSCLFFALLSSSTSSLLFLSFFGPRPLILSSLLLSCCWSSSLEVCAAASSSFCFLLSCFSVFGFDVVVLGRVLGQTFLFFFSFVLSFSFLSFGL